MGFVETPIALLRDLVYNSYYVMYGKAEENVSNATKMAVMSRLMSSNTMSTQEVTRLMTSFDQPATEQSEPPPAKEIEKFKYMS